MSPGREPGPQGSGEWNANDWPGELVNRAIHRLPAEIGGDLGEDRVGQEALFVGLVVEFLEFLARDIDALREGGLGIEPGPTPVTLVRKAGAGEPRPTGETQRWDY